MENLIGELARFPGVGRRSAERMALDLISDRSQRLETLVAALQHLKDQIGVCPVCGYFTSGGDCNVCAPHRHQQTILIVERPLDVVALEKSGGYHGLYHVLGGHLSPLKGIGPDKLRLDSLFQRLANPEVEELILATSPSVEGDATALYITRHIDNKNLKITRLGRGVPMGGSLEFADSGTLRMALEGRQSLEG